MFAVRFTQLFLVLVSLDMGLVVLQPSNITKRQTSLDPRGSDMNIFRGRGTTIFPYSQRGVMGLLVLIKGITEYILWLGQRNKHLGKTEDRHMEKGKVAALFLSLSWESVI